MKSRPKTNRILFPQT